MSSLLHFPSFTTTMQSLVSLSQSFHPLSNFTNRTLQQPLTKPISSNLPWSSKRKLEFKVCSSSSTLSSIPTPYVPELEIQEEGGKFDWFSNWYPLAPVCDLDKRVPHAKTVMGLDVVVWWDKIEGKWQVFDDKCPHRLAPLSEGRIDQFGRLQCVYHGWCFDGAGDCKFIPQAPPEGPQLHTFKKACAAAYPSFEQNKIVWFWPSTDPKYKDIMIKEKPPCIPEVDDPSYACLMGQRDIPYGYEVLTENLMDPAHVPYAHRGLMRMPKLKNRPKADREGGRPLDITIQTLNIKGFLGVAEMGYNKFIAPCLFCVIPHSKPVSMKEESTDNAHQGNRRALLVFICVPVGPGKSRLIWIFPRNFAVWVDQVIPRWVFHVGQNLILDSDLYLLHLEERKIEEIGSSNWQKACFVPTKSDALVIGFRKWLKKYSDGRIDWGAKFKGYVPPTPPREQLLDRYWSHVVHCSSCRAAVPVLKALEVALQVISVALIGIVAAAKQSLMSTLVRTSMVSCAVVCFVASRWLSYYIYKSFYYHDYSHALK